MLLLSIVDQCLLDNFDIQRTFLATAGTFVQTHMVIRAVQTTSARPGTATGASVNVNQIERLLHFGVIAHRKYPRLFDDIPL